MWSGNIKDLKSCGILSAEAVKVIQEFISKNDLLSLEKGRYVLSDKNFVNVSEYITKEFDGKYEVHKKYADVQLIISGCEKIRYADKASEIIKEYDEAGDYYLCKVEVEKEFTLSSGQACVFLPEEPHAPSLNCDGEQKVKKAVFKILINERC